MFSFNRFMCSFPPKQPDPYVNTTLREKVNVYLNSVQTFSVNYIMTYHLIKLYQYIMERFDGAWHQNIIWINDGLLLIGPLRIIK